MGEDKEQNALELRSLGALRSMVADMQRFRDLLPAHLRNPPTSIPVVASLVPPLPSFPTVSAVLRDAVPLGLEGALGESARKLSSDAFSVLGVTNALRTELGLAPSGAITALQPTTAVVGPLIERQTRMLQNALTALEKLNLEHGTLQRGVLTELSTNMDSRSRVLLEQLGSVGNATTRRAPYADNRGRRIQVDREDERDTEPRAAHPEAATGLDLKKEGPVLGWLRQRAVLADWLAALVTVLTLVNDLNDNRLDQILNLLSDLVEQAAEADQQLAEQDRPERVAKSAPLRTEASSDATVVCRVLPADAVSVILQQGAWLYVFVEAANGEMAHGWLYQRHVK